MWEIFAVPSFFASLSRYFCFLLRGLFASLRGTVFDLFDIYSKYARHILISLNQLEVVAYRLKVSFAGLNRCCDCFTAPL